ncbi:hypothetical protein NQ318_001941 [Aromia moschata]|uniref:SET domain-containing protein n=1 Tax=Aromia moschata TaxID=1265417 RepID=A0AAV8Z2R3_9CUCU|nr:hypothetical protein NQ318_001941 [Aromia moschata]
MEDEEVDKIVKTYFANEEWERFADILKTRYRNMYRNYMSIPDAALFMPMPDFMLKSKQKEQTHESLSKNCHVDKSKIKPPKRKVPEINKDVNRYPKRNVQKINYYEEQEPICDNCDQEYLDFCEKCGMLVALHDNPIPMGTENRARETVPKGALEVRPSPIHGFGVFTLRNIKKGIQMGPYQGIVTRVDTTNGYAWKLRDGRLIDAGDEKNSNWMRYVNCARNSSEQNVVAFQYKGRLFYRTSKEIRKNEELLVYYGQSFARVLGIDTRKYFEPVKEQIVEEGIFCCQFCHAGLSTSYYKDTHEKYCRFRPNRMNSCTNEESYPCRFCSVLLTSRNFLEEHEKFCRSKPSLKKKKLPQFAFNLS